MNTTDAARQATRSPWPVEKRRTEQREKTKSMHDKPRRTILRIDQNDGTFDNTSETAVRMRDLQEGDYFRCYGGGDSTRRVEDVWVARAAPSQEPDGTWGIEAERIGSPVSERIKVDYCPGCRPGDPPHGLICPRLISG